MWVDTKQFQHVGAELAGVFAEAEGTCSSTDDKEKCAQRQRPPVVRLPSCRSFLSPLCPSPSPPSFLFPPWEHLQLLFRPRVWSRSGACERERGVEASFVRLILPRVWCRCAADAGGGAGQEEQVRPLLQAL